MANYLIIPLALLPSIPPARVEAETPEEAAKQFCTDIGSELIDVSGWPHHQRWTVLFDRDGVEVEAQMDLIG